jgi:hypothetical protein
MNILLCLLIAWVTPGLLFVGLGLLFVEHFSITSQVTIDDQGISDQAPQTVKIDHAMDEAVQKGRELADACDALAQWENTVTLAPRDAIPTTHSVIAYRNQRMGAVIIRDPRLTRARTLGDQSGGAEEDLGTPEIGAISEAMEVSAEINHH